MRIATDYLFVYGTLRRGSAHPMADWLASCAHWCDEAWCRGALYSLGRYPGLVMSLRHRTWVKGDLFRLRSSRSLERLDAYEGCARTGSDYARIKTAVVLPGGKTVQAWLYEFRRAVGGLQRVDTGDWLAEGGCTWDCQI